MDARTPFYRSPYFAVTQKHGEDFQDGKECRQCRKPKNEWGSKRKQFYCSERCSDAFHKYHWANFVWAGIREAIHKRDGERCIECGKKLVLYDAQIDHVVAIMNDGHPNNHNNLRTLCKSCHPKKTVKDLRENKKIRRIKSGQKLITDVEK